jgi:hypothetical protein
LKIGFISSLKSAWAFFEPLAEMAKNAFENLANYGQWFYDNWGKVWGNAGEIVKAVFLDIWETIKWMWGPNGVINGFFITAGKAIGKAIKAGISGKNIAEAFTQEFSKYTDDTLIKGFGNIGKNTEIALAKAGVTKAPELVGGLPDFSGVMAGVDMILAKDKQSRDALAEKVKSMFEKPQDTGKGENKKTAAAAEQSIVNTSMVEMLRSAFRFRETAQNAVMSGSMEAARLQSRMFGMGSVDPQKQAANSLKTIDTQMKEVLKKVDAAVAAMTGIKQNTQGFAGIGGTKRIGR